MKKPNISIVIPTYNSERFIKMCLTSIFKQQYPKNKIEAIVVDNDSKDSTPRIAKSLGAKVFIIKGSPPKVCEQRNIGIKKARGEYVYILDHDMELPPNFFQAFASQVKKTQNHIDAWYVPEKIVSTSIMKSIRNYESAIIKDTVVAASRIIKRHFLIGKKLIYDTSLSGGPADWDMDIQLKLARAKMKTLNTYVFHHEENLTFWKYITKKGSYVEGIKIYTKKWSKKNKVMYNSIVKRQFGAWYRLVTIFFEKGKWKITIKHLHIYILMLLVTIIKGLKYLKNR